MDALSHPMAKTFGLNRPKSHRKVGHTRDGQTRIYDGPRWSGRCKYEQQDQKRDRQVPDEQTDTLWTLDNYNVGRQIQEHVEMARHMYTVD